MYGVETIVANKLEINVSVVEFRQPLERDGLLDIRVGVGDRVVHIGARQSPQTEGDLPPRPQLVGFARVSRLNEHALESNVPRVRNGNCEIIKRFLV